MARCWLDWTKGMTRWAWWTGRPVGPEWKWATLAAKQNKGRKERWAATRFRAEIDNE
jgi:hypothetical protein